MQQRLRLYNVQSNKLSSTQIIQFPNITGNKAYNIKKTEKEDILSQIKKKIRFKKKTLQDFSVNPKFYKEASSNFISWLD